MTPKTAKSSKRKAKKDPRPGQGSPKPEDGEVGRSATLETIVETLGSDVLRIITAPRGLDVPVSDPMIHDPTEPLRFGEGEVVLAVGSREDDAATLQLIREAGSAKAAAVAIKLRGDSTPLQEAAEQAKVALLAVQPEMTWNQSFSLLRSALASAGTVPDSEASGTPVGDLFALANAVAAMVGGPATIEDPQSRVLAYSSLDEPVDEPRRQTILGRQVPETWMKRLKQEGIFKKLWTSEEAIEIRLPYEGLKPRLAIAVKAGGEILGSIWVQEGSKPLGPDAKRAMEEAGQIAALHMIRHSASEDIERRVRGELLRSVLEGRATIDDVANRLGLDAASSFVVAVFELIDLEEADGRILERTRSLVALYLETFHRRAVCSTIGNSIFAVIPIPEDGETSRLKTITKKVIDQADSSLKVDLRAGIGSVVSRLGLVHKSKEEAERVLRVLAAPESPQNLASIDDVRAESILVELQELAAERPELGLGKLQALSDHDTEHNTAYVPTLRAYFDAYGDIGQAAEAVSVHSNTFRYRMRRLCEISGLDLNDPTERLVTELQLRIF